MCEVCSSQRDVHDLNNLFQGDTWVLSWGRLMPSNGDNCNYTIDFKVETISSSCPIVANEAKSLVEHRLECVFENLKLVFDQLNQNIKQ